MDSLAKFMGEWTKNQTYSVLMRFKTTNSFIKSVKGQHVSLSYAAVG